MFNLRQLKSFIYVAQYKSFTKAAKLLYMTQPAISAQIKALEDRLDVQLMERNDKQVVLTDAGKIFLDEAEKVLASYERIVEALDELKGLRRGHLKVAASTIPGEYILPKYIGAFKEKYPQISVELTITDTEQVVASLKDRVVDLGVTGAQIKSDVIKYDDLFEDELIIVAAPGSEIAQQRTHALDDLAQQKYILREPGSGTRSVMFKRLKKLQIDPAGLDVVMELGSTRAVITAVESGLGISIVSRWAAQEALQLGALKEIVIREWDPKRPLYLAWNNNRYLSQTAKTFMEKLKEYKFN